MKIPIYQVDAFTNRIFGGNPAAVCPLEKWLPDNILASIAAENNLSETAFFIKSGRGYEIRWFTPEVEVDLCGHATLATAHVIFEHLDHRGKEVVFTSHSGELRVIKRSGWLVMDFPASEISPQPVEDDLVKALGTVPLEAWKARDIMAVLENENEVWNCRPDFFLLGGLDAIGVIVTAPGDSVDFVSRFFAPRVGINEDPVTGSSHTMLIPYWSKKLKKKKMRAEQISRRMGNLRCEYREDRVLISGQARTYLVGTIEAE